MLSIMVAFFGVIIAVNITMAYNAISSWSGLVVKNTYVASQEFNDKAETGKEQAALEWQQTATFADGIFTYKLTDRDGNPVQITGGTAEFKRPVGDVNDTKVTLSADGSGLLSGPLELDEGAWIMEVNSDAGLDDPYRHIVRILIKDGKMQ